MIRVPDRWETSQIERLEKGLEHGLPRDHPEVMRRNSRAITPMREHVTLLHELVEILGRERGKPFQLDIRDSVHPY